MTRRVKSTIITDGEFDATRMKAMSADRNSRVLNFDPATARVSTVPVSSLGMMIPHPSQLYSFGLLYAIRPSEDRIQILFNDYAPDQFLTANMLIRKMREWSASVTVDVDSV